MPIDRSSPARRASAAAAVFAAAALAGLLAPIATRAQGADETRFIYLPLALRGQNRAFPGSVVAPSPTATPSGPTSTATATPSPTPTWAPSVTPSATPSPTATRAPEPVWLAYVNLHRALAHVPPVVENPDWSRGGALHAKYMVKNDHPTHFEDRARPFYTAEGDAAGQNGNVAVNTDLDLPATVPIDSWMTGAFHMLGPLDPKLFASGYGDYSEDIGMWHFGATLDVSRGRGAVPEGVTYPVRYPEEGESLPNLAFRGFESPDPLESCPGFEPPTGPPLALLLGPGDVTPRVTRTSLRDGGGELAHCAFDETTYVHPDPADQRTGRGTLGMRDAVIVLPRATLAAGERYEVTVVANGTTHSWAFFAGRGLGDARASWTSAPAGDRRR